MAANFLFNRMYKLGEKMQNSDEPWKFTEEPHSSRRLDILRKHPEIKKLMGHDPGIVYIVSFEILAQLTMCYIVQNLSWCAIFCLSYVIGATLNHSLGSAIHEIGHNLAFGHKYPLRNRILGMICNLPMVVPYSVAYKRYHSDHHRYLGDEERDVDIPSRIEALLFKHWTTRLVWLFLHPVIHAIRPYCKSPKFPSTLEVVNFVAQMSFNFTIYEIFGHRSFIYLLGGTFLGLGFHPLAGHFISEHYLFNNGHRATYSYYGPLNSILFNVGYHIEHHDFPYIPYTRLPELRRLAPDYYDNLPHHTSWLRVLFDFVFDPDMGPQARAVGYKAEDAKEAIEMRREETLKDDAVISEEPAQSGMIESGCLDEKYISKNSTIGNDDISSKFE